MSVNEMLMAAAGTAGGAPLYVDDVYSTFLYTGNGSTQTITNGIDLAGKGGLVWIKRRDNSISHALFDTQRGATKYLSSDLTNAEATNALTLTSFNSNGFSLNQTGITNQNAGTFASWTFREAPKFFDVVTYTGTGSDITINHNLGSAPGMVIIKRTGGPSGWCVWHRSLPTVSGFQQYQSGVFLNTTDANDAYDFLTTTPTSTNIGVRAGLSANGSTYVAYLFAHDAGGFGTAGTDNIISCGSISAVTNTDVTVTLGYEPQYILIKASNTSGSWYVIDAMRGMKWSTGSDGVSLFANSSAAEETGNNNNFLPRPTANGFILGNSLGLDTGQTLIYMAIRRPMKTPTTGTEVFAADIGSSSGNITFDAGFPVDLIMYKARTATGELPVWDRLRGGTYLSTNDTDAESANDTNAKFDRQTSWVYTSAINFSDYIGWMFKRAPGFFDIVCYTGTGSATTIAHNLGVAPELMIVKRRNGTTSWTVGHISLGIGNYLTFTGSGLNPDGTAANYWGNAWPTSTSLNYAAGYGNINDSGATYVAYLFASVPGVSKVGTYTGNGSNQTINCGFSAGARFVLIKRTDAAGDWCVFDTTRGIVSGNDPFLQLNSTAAEVTGEDAVDPANSGFVVNQTTENLNVNNATYLFLAIA